GRPGDVERQRRAGELEAREAGTLAVVSVHHPGAGGAGSPHDAPRDDVTIEELEMLHGSLRRKSRFLAILDRVGRFVTVLVWAGPPTGAAPPVRRAPGREKTRRP